MSAAKSALRILLPRVQHLDDLNPIYGYAVYHDVIRMSDHLARAGHPPKAEEVGVFRSRQNGLLDQGFDSSRGARVVLCNMACCRRPKTEPFIEVVPIQN